MKLEQILARMIPVISAGMKAPVPQRNTLMQVRLRVSLKRQQLFVLTEKGEYSYPVSTAKAGAGERNGSGCTPRGRHFIRACIGSDQPLGLYLSVADQRARSILTIWQLLIPNAIGY